MAQLTVGELLDLLRDVPREALVFHYNGEYGEYHAVETAHVHRDHDGVSEVFLDPP